MSKQKGGPGRQGRWALFVTFFTFVVTIGLGLLANRVFENISLIGALLVQLILVGAGVFCDLLGIAVAASDVPPFLSMASKRIRGAEKSIWLLKNAERVTNIFNDVLGDIFGVLSGATGATIVVMLLLHFPTLSAAELYTSIGMTSLIAALMVGGKAAGKAFAMHNSREIVLTLGRLLSIFSFAGKRPQRKKP